MSPHDMVSLSPYSFVMLYSILGGEGVRGGSRGPGHKH